MKVLDLKYYVEKEKTVNEEFLEYESDVVWPIGRHPGLSKVTEVYQAKIG